MATVWIPASPFGQIAGGIDALLAVAGEDNEPVLAAAAMQALTGLVGSADAKAMLLQHPGFLDTLLNSVDTGRSSASLFPALLTSLSLSLVLLHAHYHCVEP